MYESAVITPNNDYLDDNLRSFMSAKGGKFSGVRHPEVSTMGISTPQDRAFAKRAKEVAPELANEAAYLGLSFAPGSGEVISAQQSADATARARKALSNGDYVNAASEGLDAVVNAVGSIPIAHQVMAAAKGILGGSHMMMGVIKPKGGNWLAGEVESNLNDMLLRYAGPNAQHIEDWAQTKLKKSVIS